MKKLLIIVFIINILLVVDIIVLVLMRELIPITEPIIYFWIKPGNWFNDNSVNFIYYDIALKLIFLFVLLFLVILKSRKLYIQITLTTIFLLYGFIFIYIYIVSDIISFQFSALIKFIVFCISFLFFINSYHIPFSKKIAYSLMIIFFLPIILFESIHVISKHRSDEKQIVGAIQSLINYEINKERIFDSTTTILLYNTSLRTERSDIINTFIHEDLTIMDKIFMYPQIDRDNPKDIGCNSLSNVICVYEFGDSLCSDDKISVEKLWKKYNTPFVYFISIPIFNYRRNLAIISTMTFFIPEPTGRYMTFKRFLMEKINGVWKIREIK